jgi:hypothetical protein
MVGVGGGVIVLVVDRLPVFVREKCFDGEHELLDDKKNVRDVLSELVFEPVCVTVSVIVDVGDSPLGVMVMVAVEDSEIHPDGVSLLDPVFAFVGLTVRGKLNVDVGIRVVVRLEVVSTVIVPVPSREEDLSDRLGVSLLLSLTERVLVLVRESIHVRVSRRVSVNDANVERDAMAVKVCEMVTLFEGERDRILLAERVGV